MRNTNFKKYAGISKRSQRGGLENRLPKRHGGSNPSSCAKSPDFSGLFSTKKEITMPLLDDLIKRFSATTIGFPDSQELEHAIAKAHTDMSRRATGHKPEIQEESIRWLANRFKKLSPFAYKKQEDFDKWHEDTCNAYCKELNSFAVRKGFSFIMTYGRAQKVLNMTFKYLYCTSKYKARVEKIIPFLHMTLDGYTQGQQLLAEHYGYDQVSI